MRGVSERESGGRAGWAAESRGGGAAAVPRTPWHRAQPPRPRGEARRQLGPAGAPLPNSWPRPGGLRERRGGDVGRGLQAVGPSPASSLSGAGRRGWGWGGGWPRKGGAPERVAGGPRGAPRTKGDGDGSSVVKTTCAGGGPRPGRGLGALHLNPFAAAASFLRLVGGRERPVLPPGAGEVRAPGRGRALAGRDPGAARGPPPSPPRHLAPPTCPAPFPTWIPGRLANSLLREAGRGAGAPYDPIAPADGSLAQLPCCGAFRGGALRTLRAGEERCVLSQGAGAGVARPQAHTTTGAGFPTSPYPAPSAQVPQTSLCTLRTQDCKRLCHCTLGPGKTCMARWAPAPTRSRSRGSSQTPCRSLAWLPPVRELAPPGQAGSWVGPKLNRSGLARTRCLLPRQHPTPLACARKGLILGFLEGWGTGPHTPPPLTLKRSEI